MFTEGHDASVSQVLFTDPRLNENKQLCYDRRATCCVSQNLASCCTTVETSNVQRIHNLVGWRRRVVVRGVRRMNEVNALRARLVPGWVTIFGRVYHLGM